MSGFPVKVYRIDFMVQGRGDFPLDMLRYDRAWPASEADSGRIAGRVVVDELGRAPRRVTLSHYEAGKAPLHFHAGDPEFAAVRVGLTPARWRSFGWRIVHVEGMAPLAELAGAELAK